MAISIRSAAIIKPRFQNGRTAVSQKKSSQTTPVVAEGGSFEQKLAELEQLVEQLESGQLELAESLQRFRQGVELGSQCRAMLDEAQQVIEQVVSSTNDANDTGPLSPDSERGETSG